MGEEMKAAGIADNGERSTMYQQWQEEANACSMLLCYKGPSSCRVYLYCTTLNLVKVDAVTINMRLLFLSFYVVCIYLRGYFWIETQQFLSVIYMRSSPCRRCLTAPSKYPWNMSWVVIQSHLNRESTLPIPPPLHLNLQNLRPCSSKPVKAQSIRYMFDP